MENLNSETTLHISQNTMLAYKNMKLRWNPQIQSVKNIFNNEIRKAIQPFVIYPRKTVENKQHSTRR